MTDVLIVGAGPAGLTAAIYAARAGLSVKVFDKNMYGGQMILSAEVENYPGILSTGGPDLAIQMYSHATSLGAEVVFEEVTAVHFDGEVKKVDTAGASYEGRSLIIAGGASRRKLDVPGEEQFAGRGVSYCATCDGAFFRGQDVAIVGGGNTALEDTIFLANNCKKVYLIHRRNSFRGERVLQDAVMNKPNVEIIYNGTVDTISGSDKVEQCTVNTPDGPRTLDVSAVFVAVGLVPEVAMLGDCLPLTPENYIIAGEDCTTPVPGVFVAGDIRQKQVRQIVTAVADGAVAAIGTATYLGQSTLSACTVQIDAPQEVCL